MARKSGPRRERKSAVWKRDRYRCCYCGRPVEIPSPDVPAYLWATVDHKIPRSKGGSNKAENLVTCCMPCNKRKADTDHKAFIESGKHKLSYNRGFRSLSEQRQYAESKRNGR